MTIVQHKPMALPMNTNFHGKILAHQQGFADGIRAGNRKNYLDRNERVAANQMVRIENDLAQTDDILKQIPLRMRGTVVKKATRAAAIISRNQMTRILKDASAPHGPDEGMFPGDSKETGTYRKKSRQQRAARDMRISMVKSVRIKAKQYNQGRVYLMMVGPRRPEGNQAHILEFGGVIQLWGTDLQYRLKPRPFMEPAIAISMPAQKTAYVSKTKAEWNSIKNSLQFKQRGRHS